MNIYLECAQVPTLQIDHVNPVAQYHDVLKRHKLLFHPGLKEYFCFASFVALIADDTITFVSV